jgi:hypothetical protein
MTATVTLSPPNANDNDLHRNVQVTVNNIALPVLDAIAAPVTFPCNFSDNITVVAVDANAAGSSPPSDTFVIMAPAAPAPTVPAKPTVLGVAFTP